MERRGRTGGTLDEELEELRQLYEDGRLRPSKGPEDESAPDERLRQD
jgi:hypothetical protein